MINFTDPLLSCDKPFIGKYSAYFRGNFEQNFSVRDWSLMPGTDAEYIWMGHENFEGHNGGMKKSTNNLNSTDDGTRTRNLSITNRVL